MVSLRVTRLPERDPSVALPARATPQAAGLDLRANLDRQNREKGLVLKPGERKLVTTGLRIELPQDYEGQIRSRSGWALKHGISVLNSPGTIDSDYRGEVGVILINHGEEDFQVFHGDRIAQLVVSKVVSASIEETTELSQTKRSQGGFGSTGKR